MFNKNYVVFIGLNPSTADETKDDPTIRRCIGFAKDWGFGALCMLNLFAFRSTNPKSMMATVDPIGPRNDDMIKIVSEKANTIIAAWGNHGNFLRRSQEICDIFSSMNIYFSCLGFTKNGSPKHPLYIKKNQPLIPWPCGSC